MTENSSQGVRRHYDYVRAVLTTVFPELPAMINLMGKHEGCNPNLDDVRCGVARVTSRGRVVWVKRLSKKLRKMGYAFLFYEVSRRWLNHKSIGRTLFEVGSETKTA